VGTRIVDLVIQDAAVLVEDLRRRGITVAMMAVPAAEAQATTDRLVKAGVRFILCYAPTSVRVPDSVRVQYIDPVVHLQRMTYYQR